MRLGLFLISPQWPGRTHGQALAETVRLAHLAERVGLDEVWLAEHHFMSYGVCPSAVTLAGHLLGATDRIGVGTAVSVLPSTHPVALAEQAAMLDQLAPGRLHLGVGRGGPWRELAGARRRPTRGDAALGARVRRGARRATHGPARPDRARPGTAAAVRRGARRPRPAAPRPGGPARLAP